MRLILLITKRLLEFSRGGRPTCDVEFRPRLLSFGAFDALDPLAGSSKTSAGATLIDKADVFTVSSFTGESSGLCFLDRGDAA
jgi:hypothetical protein